ncbi:hypothetical protein E2C01_038587 [Portunus trituberculatus]|uniref:Uncharacterized protein n=1 Tax=Portunus trituberculatus TaxID=210409 RepID=A0A5B7FHK8_PORTR|nr:hypothetical protein [Portunus trituberculatus]
MAQPHHKPAAGQKRDNPQKMQRTRDADRLLSFQKKGKDSDEGDPVAEKTSHGKRPWKVKTRFGTGSTRRRPTKVEDGVLGSRRRRRSPENSVNPLGTDLTSAGGKLVYLNTGRMKRVLSGAPLRTQPLERTPYGAPLRAHPLGRTPQGVVLTLLFSGRTLKEHKRPRRRENVNREGGTELRTSNPKEEKKDVQFLSIGNTQEGGGGFKCDSKLRKRAQKEPTWRRPEKREKGDENQLYPKKPLNSQTISPATTRKRGGATRKNPPKESKGKRGTRE